MKLKNKVALITGSSRGIGRAIAIRFAAEGASVVINYFGSDDEAMAVKEAIEQDGGVAHTVKADVSNPADLRRMFQEADDRFGRIDILVNNAGIEYRRPFIEIDEEQYDRVMAVNLKGPFFGTQEFVRRAIERSQPGRVINISSVHEDLPFPGFTPYCLSKGGMRMLTRNLAVELGPYNITVNGIAPGAIATPMNAKLLNDPSRLEPLLEQIPLSRLGKPEEIAGLAAFLASDDASYVTGATYFIDGGLTVHYEE